MKDTAFRSVDDWKSALMTLPENGFFELLRSVFGNIKTPFNKQRLMDDLFTLLSRDDIRKTIAAYINEQDHKIIAALALLREPVQVELERFFAGEFTPLELHALVLNLEERLIIYRFRAEGVLRLALNPVLEKVLEPFAMDTGPLFPSVPLESSLPAEINSPMTNNAKKTPALKGSAARKGRKTPEETEELAPSVRVSDTRILAAFFAFLYDHSEEEIFRLDADAQPRVLRKKVLEEGKKVFPDLDLELAVRTLLYLELFRADSCSLVPNMEKIAGYSALSSAERQKYWAAGVYLSLSDTAQNESASLYRGRLRRIATTINRFTGLIDIERKYPEVTLRRIMELIEKEDGGGTGNLWGARLFDDRIRLPFEPFLAAMEKAGLLRKKENLWEAAGSIALGSDPAVEKDTPLPAKASREKSAETPVIVMNTAFSFILYPEIAFADAMSLAAFCSVEVPASSKWPEGASVCLALTRKSAVRGFDQGMEAAGMIELLRRLSLDRIDENMSWTLKDWESRYAGVSLDQGIVLSLAEDRRYLVEARPLSSLVRRTLSPGVYLLSCADRTEAVKALRKAGVDIIAQPPPDLPALKSETENSWLGSSRLFSSSFYRLGSIEPVEFLKHGETQIMRKTTAGKESDSIKERFRKVLEKTRLGKQERDELEARIERRLILSEAQLEGAFVRYEKLEARGLDYTGKAAIAKHAIEFASVLDVSWPGPGGRTKQVFGVPLALEKKEGESVLVLKPQTVEDTDSSREVSETTPGEPVSGETIRIPLGKISLLRRTKQSIFGE